MYAAAERVRQTLLMRSTLLPMTASIPVPSHAPATAWQGLRQIHALQSLSDERLAELAAQCRWQHLDPNQILAGAYADQRLYMLVQGSLRVSSFTQSGRGLTLGEITQGVFFGGLPQQQSDCTDVPLVVDAVTPCLVASLAHDDVEALLMHEPLVLRAFIGRLSDLVVALAQRVVNLGTLSVRSHLHALLLARAERAGIAQGQSLLAPAPRQTDLALLLGTSREEVAREMSRLARLGLLRREGRNLRICHVDGLRVLLEEAR